MNFDSRNIAAYTLTPEGLKLAVKSTMPNFKFSKFPLRSVIRSMKLFTPKLDPHLQDVWKNKTVPSYILMKSTTTFTTGGILKKKCGEESSSLSQKYRVIMP